MKTLEYYGGVVGGDNTPALNAAIAAQETELVVGRGSYLFNSKPNAIGHDMKIVGQGVSASVFVRNYVPANQDDTLLLFNGQDGPFGGGVFGLQIDAAVGDGGVAIYLYGASQTKRAALMNFRDIWVSSNHGKLWNRNLVINGLAIPDTPSNGGIRDLRFDNCYFFGSQGNGVEIWNGKNVWMIGGGIYNAAAGGGLAVCGGGATTRSEKIHVNMSIGGQINLNNTNDFHFYGATAGAFCRDGTSDTVRILGHVGTLYGSPAVREKIL
jgi:hypothetical protein